MIPRTFPTDADGNMIVAEITPDSADAEWREYIPVQVVAEVEGKAYRYDEDGYVPVEQLQDTTGLIPWKDYVPVVFVQGRTNAWHTSGYIPVVTGGPPPTPYPAALFENGENGVWLDISDLSTLFQDDAGTTPVTAPGQPVGLILDKSGNDNHFVQATSGNRPTLQQDEHGRYYLEFDGTNDLLSTAAVTWGEQVSFFALARVEADGVPNQVLLQTDTDANRPSVRLHFDADSKYSATVLGSGGVNRWQSTAHLPPHEALITAVVDTTAQSAAATWPVYRINGADAKDNQLNAAVVAGSLGGAMHIGARASATQAFEGRLYGLVVVDKLADPADIAGVEAYLGPAIQPV